MQPVLFDSSIYSTALRTGDEAKRIGPAAGIPIFGLDALSSAGCGPPATVATRPGTV